nr:hypothetical protein [Ktedonobacteraceae bacterium]
MSFFDRMNPFKGRQPGATATAPPPNPTPQPQPKSQQPPNTGPLPGSNGASTPGAQGDLLNLVNYTPEQLVQHVDQRIARIQFGWSFSTRLMEGYSEVWAWLGPIILVLGTIGEVFLVLWLRQKAQEIIAGLSIVAVALV